ncbi:MAG: RNA polymerase sigma factor [Phycisphaeraceae bacterium]|nr:MAG: RNA polymerase sigma factor [Phycisphaeraceae bacterium]
MHSMTIDLQQQTDEDLIRLYAKNGKPEALHALAARYEHMLLALATAMLTGDRATAEDAVQDTWMRVIRNARTFRQQSSARTWIYRILIHRCRDLLRARKHRRTSPLLDQALSTGYDNDSHDSSDHPEVTKALAELSDARREIVLLCYHRGLTHQQVSDVLQIPIGTVKTRLYAAMDELRAMLGAEVEQ